MSRATKIETDKRIFTVQSWLINGVPDYLILKQCVDQFKVGERQAKNYLAKAYETWRDANEANIDQLKQTAIDKLKQNIRTLKDVYKGTPAGLRVMLQYEKELNKLQALYPAKQHIHRGDPESPIVVTEETIEERIAKLIKKAVDSGDDRITSLLKK